MGNQNSEMLYLLLREWAVAKGKDARLTGKEKYGRAFLKPSLLRAFRNRQEGYMASSKLRRKLLLELVLVYSSQRYLRCQERMVQFALEQKKEGA